MIQQACSEDGLIDEPSPGGALQHQYAGQEQGVVDDRLEVVEQISQDDVTPGDTYGCRQGETGGQGGDGGCQQGDGDGCAAASRRDVEFLARGQQKGPENQYEGHHAEGDDGA